MKKSLVALLVSASIASPALAKDNGLKVKLTGRMDVQAGSMNENKIYNSSNPANPSLGQELKRSGIVNDTKIDLKIDGDAKSFTYGGFIRFNADTSKSTSGENSIANKTMIFLQHNKIGRIEAGDTDSAGGLFEVSTPLMDRGSYGVDGFWAAWLGTRSKTVTEIINNNLGGVSTAARDQVVSQAETRTFEFLLSPNLLSNYSGKYYAYAPKINFFTKPLGESLTLGISFIHDLDSHGTINGVAMRTGPVDAERAAYPATFRNIVNGGLMYENKLKDITYKFSAAGEIGKAKTAGVRNLKAMEVALRLGYKDYTFSTSYGDWFKSLTLKNPTARAKQGAKYWTAAIGKDIDKFGLGLSLMKSIKAGGVESFSAQVNSSLVAQNAGFAGIFNNSTFSEFSYNTAKVAVVDIDYKLAPGFLPYASAAFFNLKESKGYKSSGQVYMVGTRLTF